MADLNIHGIKEPYLAIPQAKLDKFKKLNEGGIQQKVYQFIRSLFISLDNKMAAHFSAEHLTQGALGGHHQRLVLRHINKKIFHKKGPNYENLKRNLEFAEQVANKLVETSPQKVATFVKENMKKLKHGESLTVPCGYKTTKKGHSTALQVERQQDDPNGHPRYLVRLHNEGEGLSYHYVDPERCKYQTVLEIANVTEENLCNSSFFDQLFALKMPNQQHSIQQLYEDVLPLLKGEILPRSSDDRLWSRGQLGKSCPARSILSLIRSTLNEEEYKQLKLEVKTDFLFKMYREIKYRRGNTEINRIVALEIVKNLKHQLGELPTELAIVEKELKNLHGTSRKEIEHQKLYHELDQFISRMSKELPDDQAEIKPEIRAEILDTFEKFKDNFKDEKDLTREDLYHLSYRIACMQRRLSNLFLLSPKQEKQKQELFNFFHNVLTLYKRAHVETYYPKDDPWIKQIKEFADLVELLVPPEPEKLEKIKKLMSPVAGIPCP